MSGNGPAMRLTHILLLILSLSPTALRADEASLRADLERRLHAAFGHPEEAERQVLLKAVFHQQGLDENTKALLDRTVQRLLDGNRRQIDFGPLPRDARFVNVVNGYEYRPNLEPLGHVVLTNPDEPAGNDTRIYYGKHPSEGRYYIPAVIRKLVNTNRPKDKQLQINVVGIGHPPVKFGGWCDLELSDGSIRRISLQDNGAGNQTRILRGQRVTACELTRISVHGTISLQLFEDGTELFKKRVGPDIGSLKYPQP